MQTHRKYYSLFLTIESLVNSQTFLVQKINKRKKKMFREKSSFTFFAVIFELKFTKIQLYEELYFAQIINFAENSF